MYIGALICTIRKNRKYVFVGAGHIGGAGDERGILFVSNVT